MPEVTSYLLFESNPMIEVDELVDDLARRWPDLGAPVNLVKGDDDLGFVLAGGIVMMVSLYESFDFAADTDAVVLDPLWPGSEVAKGAHQSHIAIAVSLDEGRYLDAATLATQVTASAVSAAPGCLGVYWPGTPQLIMPQVFLQRSSILPRPPLDLWVNITVGNGRDGSTTAVTSGLESFGLREIEVVDAPESHEQIEVRLRRLVAQVVLQRRNLAHGARVEHTDAHEIVVAVGRSKLGRTHDVSELTFQPPSNQDVVDAASSLSSNW